MEAFSFHEIGTMIEKVPYAGPIILLLASLLAARLAVWFVDRVLSRLASRTSFTFDDQFLAAIRRPIWVTVLLIGATYSIEWIGPPAHVAKILLACLKTIGILVWAIAFYKIIHLVFASIMARMREKMQEGLEVIHLLENLSRLGILVIAGLKFMSTWGINITPLLASAGIAGITLALAAKDTMANFFGGISIYADRPYKLGDYIILDSGERGEVVAIGIRSTRIITRDEEQVSIPNAVMVNAKIINESQPLPNYRVRVKVGVAYGSDIDLVEETLLNVAGECPHVLPDPEPRVRFRNFGDSSLDFELLAWIKDPRRRGRVLHELNRAVYKAFQRNNIEIPFPQRTVHLVRQENS
jgi:MscS family membrane protein